MNMSFVSFQCRFFSDLLSSSMHQCPLSNTLFVFLGDGVTEVVVKNRYNTDIFMPFLSPDELDHIQPTLTD